NRAYATVLFSATLSPAEYYRDLLGMAGSQVEASAVTESEPNQESEHEPVIRPVSEPTREALWLSLPGPFQSHQLDLRRVSVSTRFRDRNRSVPPICQRIAAQYRQKPGNYLVYLSSFSYLQQLHNGLTEYCPEIPLQVQSAGMKEAERQHFINRFRNEQGLVGLAVLGGAFSEGIDLPGDALIGVFVATLGLPPYDDFHETLSQRLEQRFGDGYRYTYLYPGLRKVIQAAGRLIRSPEDYGVIELIDDRFMQPEIRALMPDWWD
ncbi:helicase C-terminal domain-containing protein, partial [Oceanospirillum sp. HFRX-1_2]